MTLDDSPNRKTMRKCGGIMGWAMAKCRPAFSAEVPIHGVVHLNLYSANGCLEQNQRVTLGAVECRATNDS